MQSHSNPDEVIESGDSDKAFSPFKHNLIYDVNISRKSTASYAGVSKKQEIDLLTVSLIDGDLENKLERLLVFLLCSPVRRIFR